MSSQKYVVYLLSLLLLGSGAGLSGCDVVLRDGNQIPKLERLSNSRFESLQRLKHTGVKSIRISPDGETLISGGDDQTVKLWDLATGKLQQTLSGHDRPVESVEISPDGKTLISGSWDGTIKRWDLVTGELQQTLFAHDDFITSVAISPDGETLASGSRDGTIKLWDLATGEQRQTLSGHDVSHLAMHPNGQTLISGEYGVGVAKIWNLTTGELQQTLRGYPDTIGSFEISADGQTLVVGHHELLAPPWIRRDNTIVLWNLMTGELQQVLPGFESNSNLAAISENVNEAESIWWDRPPTASLVSWDNLDNTTKLWWDDAAGSLQRPLGYDTNVYSVAISPDGQMLATGGGGEIKLWDLATGELHETLTSDSIFGNVMAIAFSPDGQTLVSGDGRGLKIWRQF